MAIIRRSFLWHVFTENGRRMIFQYQTLGGVVLSVELWLLNSKRDFNLGLRLEARGVRNCKFKELGRNIAGYFVRQFDVLNEVRPFDEWLWTECAIFSTDIWFEPSSRTRSSASKFDAIGITWCLDYIQDGIRRFVFVIKHPVNVDLVSFQIMRSENININALTLHFTWQQNISRQILQLRFVKRRILMITLNIKFLL